MWEPYFPRVYWILYLFTGCLIVTSHLWLHYLLADWTISFDVDNPSRCYRRPLLGDLRSYGCSCCSLYSMDSFTFTCLDRANDKSIEKSEAGPERRDVIPAAFLTEFHYEQDHSIKRLWIEENTHKLWRHLISGNFSWVKNTANGRASRPGGPGS